MKLDDHTIFYHYDFPQKKILINKYLVLIRIMIKMFYQQFILNI